MQIIQLHHSLKDRKLSHLLDLHFYNWKMNALTRKHEFLDDYTAVVG